MCLEQAVHDVLAGREAGVNGRLVDIQDYPKDPSGEVDGDLGGEQDPGACAWEEEEVAAARVVEEEG